MQKNKTRSSARVSLSGCSKETNTFEISQLRSSHHRAAQLKRQPSPPSSASTSIYALALALRAGASIAHIMTSVDEGAGEASSGRYNLADELLLLADADEPYIIPQEAAVEDMNASEQISTLDSAIDAITSSPDNVSTPEIYDLIRSYLKHSLAHLCPNACNKLLDVIASGMSSALDEAQRELDGDDPTAYSSHAETLERYAFPPSVARFGGGEV